MHPMHGLVYIWRHLHQYTECVAMQESTRMIDVFDSYENMNTEDMTHQRQSKGKADATVKVAANMHDHHNEEGPVFVQPNK